MPRGFLFVIIYTKDMCRYIIRVVYQYQKTLYILNDL